MAIPLRADFEAADLRTAARAIRYAGHARRPHALATNHDRSSQAEIGTIGSVKLQIVGDRVVKLNFHGPDGLIDRKPPGRPSRVTDAHCTALRVINASGPSPAAHGAVPGRLVDLCQWVWEEWRQGPAIILPFCCRQGRQIAAAAVRYFFNH